MEEEATLRIYVRSKVGPKFQACFALVLGLVVLSHSRNDNTVLFVYFDSKTFLGMA